MKNVCHENIFVITNFLSKKNQKHPLYNDATENFASPVGPKKSHWDLTFLGIIVPKKLPGTKKDHPDFHFEHDKITWRLDELKVTLISFAYCSKF